MMEITVANSEKDCQACPINEQCSLLYLLTDMHQNLLSQTTVLDVEQEAELKDLRRNIHEVMILHSDLQPICNGPTIGFKAKLTHSLEIARNRLALREENPARDKVRLAFAGRCAMGEMREKFKAVQASPLYRQWVEGK